MSVGMKGRGVPAGAYTHGTPGGTCAVWDPDALGMGFSGTKGVWGPFVGNLGLETCLAWHQEGIVDNRTLTSTHRSPGAAWGEAQSWVNPLLHFPTG